MTRKEFEDEVKKLPGWEQARVQESDDWTSRDEHRFGVQATRHRLSGGIHHIEAQLYLATWNESELPALRDRALAAIRVLAKKRRA